MFANLIYKELRSIILERKYLAYFITVLCLLLGSFLMQKSQYYKRFNNYLGLQQVFDKEAASWNLRYLPEQGLRVVHKPSALQNIAMGTEKMNTRYTAHYMHFTYQEHYPFMRTEKDFFAVQNTAFLPSYDFVLIISVIVSLMVLCFAYNSVSGERENGTLKLVLSYPVSRAQLILAKLAGGYATVCFPVVFYFLACLLLVQLDLDYALGRQGTLGFALIILFSLLYLLVIYLAGICVSVFCRRSPTSIALLVILWLVFVVIIHNSTVSFIEHTTKTDFIPEQLSKSKQDRNRLVELVNNESIKRFGKKEYWQMSKRENHDMFYWNITQHEKHITGVAAEYGKVLQNTGAKLDLVSYLSPSLLFTAAATDLAGTGVQAHLRLLQRVREYNRSVRRQIIELAEKRLKEKEEVYSQYIYRPIKDMDKFMHREPGIKERVRNVLWKGMAMALYAVLFFMVAFLGFVRAREV